MNSRLNEQLCLGRHRARGLERITTSALLSIIARAIQNWDVPKLLYYSL